MAYSQPNDLRNALAPGEWDPPPDPPPVTRTAADLSDDQLNTEIDQADQTIDGYISRFYATPVSDEDAAKSPVKTWSTNIAAYLATLTNRRGKDLSPNDPVVLRYTQTMVQVLAVNKGAMSLPITPQSGGSLSAGAGAVLNQPYFDPFACNTLGFRGHEPFWRDPFGTPAHQLTAQEVEIIERGMAP